MASDSEMDEFFDCEEDDVTLQALKRYITFLGWNFVYDKNI